MYSKEISVTKYLLYTLVRGIFDGMYKLKKLQGNVLNPIKVNEVLDSIFNKSTSLSVKFHPELMADAPANHCKIFGSTLLVISQNRANGASSGVSKTITSDMLLHPSIIETCSYTTPSKAEPTGRNKLSPFAKLENAKRFVPNPKNVTVIDTVAQYIR
jgi:hypothetical protein